MGDFGRSGEKTKTETKKKVFRTPPTSFLLKIQDFEEEEKSFFGITFKKNFLFAIFPGFRTKKIGPKKFFMNHAVVRNAARPRTHIPNSQIFLGAGAACIFFANQDA